MPYTILKNQKNGKVAIHVAGANSGDIIVVGNSTVSNLATGAEVLSGAAIRKVKWGCGDGFITILRHTTPVAVLSQSGEMDFSDIAVLTLNSAANVVVNMSANAFCVVEIDKVFSSVVSVY